MRKKLDIAGQRYGRLTAIKFCGKDRNGKSMWLCVCDCGKETVCSLNNLRKGNTKSCGCLSREIKPTKTHGQRKTRLYNIWSLMKNRCADKTLKNYGGRGITVCDEWQNSFEAFYQWAMQSGYNDNLSIDRIDNEKGYSPQNCRWATNKEQSRNRRTNHYVIYEGEKYLITDLEKKIGLSRKTIARRIQRGQKIEI